MEYYSSRPIFYLSHSFFSGFLERPGGLVEYAAAFLAQLNYYNWLGAVVFTAMCCMVFLAVGWWLRRVSGVAPQLAPFGAAFLLLFLREHPDCPALEIGTGLLLAMGFAMGCVVLSGTRVWLRLIACPVCSVLLFFLAGLWPSALFVVLASLFEIVAGRRWALGCGCFLSGLIGIFGTMWFCDAAGQFVPPGGRMCLVVAAVLYLYIPFLSVASALLRAVAAKTATEGAPVPRAQYGAWRFSLPGWFQKRIVKRTFAASLFILGWTLIWFGLDLQRKALAQTDYYSSRSEYDKVLAAAANIRQMSPSTKIHVWLALYHTGRLGDDLFSFGNPSKHDMLSGLGEGKSSWRAQSQTLLELGQVNEAEHLAHEALENEGEYPETLRLLAEINILKGRPAAARVFLNVLGMVPFEREWAERCLSELETDPTLSGDSKLQQVRSRQVKTDVLYDLTLPEFELVQLVRSNPHNQMAFEYLMAYYLLSRQEDRIVKRLTEPNEFEYASFPRLWEEAVLSFQTLKGIQVDLHGRQIRPETVQRFQQYCQAAAMKQVRTAEGRSSLARDFGNTYWYYHDFGHAK